MRERNERTGREGQREDEEREEGREPGKRREESVNRHGYLCRINSVQTEEGPDEVYFPE